MYHNFGMCVKDGAVHHSRQQWLISKWLGLGVTVRVSQGMGLFLFFSLCVKKVIKTFVLLSWPSTMFMT